MTNLSGQQFGEQGGLFPEDHPAMRRRTHAELTPQEYQEKPGAWFHGTYSHELPHRIDHPLSAGVHFGTLQAAKDRIEDMGPREPDFTPEHPMNTHDGFKFAPAEIHVRRLGEHVQEPHVEVDEYGGYEISKSHIKRRLPHMRNTVDNPGSDLGSNWADTSHGDDRDSGSFGEYYVNDAEDTGSVSMRVPNRNYTPSHRSSIDKAMRSGSPVHPLNRALVENHGGAGIDETIKYKSGTRTEEWRQRDPFDTEKVNHETLLPYKLRANPMVRTSEHPEDMPMDRIPTPGKSDPVRRPAITFAATGQEAQQMMGALNPQELASKMQEDGRRSISAAQGKRPERPERVKPPLWKSAFRH